MVCGLTAAARLGVLIKGGQHLERLGNARAIAFDKTGTLTRGEPKVQEVVPLNGTTPEEVLRLAAALEQGSEHPLARAIVGELRHRGLEAPPPEQFLSAPGIGVEGVVEGRALRVGRPTALWSALPDDLTPALERLEAAGATPVALAEVGIDSFNRDVQDEQDRTDDPIPSDHPVYPVHPCKLPGTSDGPNAQALGLIALADQPRAEAAAMIRALRGLGLRRLLMLTGDRERPARAVAAAVGLEEVHAELMPAEKAERLRRVEEEAGIVVMVGDGVNDAPALAAAGVSVAMGAAGTDIALETADVALMGDDLARLPEAIDLSRRTLRTVQANVAFSLGLKALFVLLVFLGQSSLWLAVLADTGASLAVTAYALRLLRYSGLRPAAEQARQTRTELAAARR
jgi:Cd2+/Zn2+-exporting ATPase